MNANFAISADSRGCHGFWTKAEALAAWERMQRAPLFSGVLLQGALTVTENHVAARGRVFELDRIRPEAAGDRWNWMFDRDEIPVGRTMTRHWARQGQHLLDEVADLIERHGANPWMFAADARHFWQFADTAAVAVLQAMTAEQAAAVLDWCDEDFDPETFGYTWPKN